MTDAQSRPNVLCISVDSLRADYTSVFNDRETTTPFLDSLDAARYDRAITPSCWTLQVHGSVFTGLYPPEHQVLDKDDSLGDRETLAELLRREGYQTRSFGYNGWLQMGDVLRGFDHRTTPTLTDSAPGKVLKKLRHALSRNRVRDEITVRNFAEALDERTEPFCHFVHLDDAHYIYTPPRPYSGMYTEASQLEIARNLLAQRRLYDSRGKVYVGEYAPDAADVDLMKDLYRGCIRMEDDFIRSMFDALERRGLLEDTLVVVFGDHGDNFGEDGIYGHQFSVADSLIRVPLVVYDPRNRFDSGDHDELAQLNDLYPTILEYCGVDPPESHSVSLLGPDERESAYTYYSVADSFVERISDEVDPDDLPPRRQYAIWRSPDERAVYYPDEDGWSDDADEELKTDLRSHLESLTVYRSSRRDDIDDSVRENLEEMGYI